MGAVGDSEDFLTVAEIAARVKLNQQTVRNWIDNGRLPALHIGRRVRIRHQDFDELLARSAAGQSPASAATPSYTADDF